MDFRCRGACGTTAQCTPNSISANDSGADAVRLGLPDRLAAQHSEQYDCEYLYWKTEVGGENTAHYNDEQFKKVYRSHF